MELKTQQLYWLYNIWFNHYTTVSLMSAKSTLVIFNLDPISLYNHSAVPSVFVANVVVQSSDMVTFAFSVGCRCAIGIATK